MQSVRTGAEQESLLTAQQVEHRLRVDSSTVYRMAADGRLPAVKVGRQWRFPAAGVEGLLSGTSVPTRAGLEPAAVAAVLELSASVLGVMMVATDMSGHPLSDVVNPCPRFAEVGEAEKTLAACVVEWRVLADDLDFTPRFEVGPLGFECARAFIRSGTDLVGMVLAGGVAPEGTTSEGMHHLDPEERVTVLRTLPKIAAALSTNETPARPRGSGVQIDHTRRTG